jgi:hypothetical protein
MVAWHRSLMTVAPREDVDATLLHPRWVYACGVELLLFGYVWLLHVVAATSSECNQLVSAISGLRCRMQRPQQQDGGDIEASGSRLRSSGGMGESIQASDGAGGWVYDPGTPSSSSSSSSSSALVPVLASDRDLARIDGLLKYAAGLNRGQGIGFVFLGKRIDIALVWAHFLRGSFVILATFGLASNFVD